ncbi:MAG TPA: SpoIID/LytB domain-containing protein [Clostridiales bacterium]|nr:SpoIID/LytB domain-containing protein [Clostridiales bacterium]HQP70774.1 SpoIID/LytB domain-containing protein [Clostridiales bacterium]
MQVRIGFLHKRESIKVIFDGGYVLSDSECIDDTTLQDGITYEIAVGKSNPAEYEWYEKLETVFTIDKLESKRDKYYLDEKSTRILKVGKQIGKSDNFEYWILKKTSDMEGKIYPSGDYRYKKIIKKEAEGTLIFSGTEYKNKIRFIPKNAASKFRIEGVSVGIDFHWDHKEDLEYEGELELMIDSSGFLTAVNIIGLEEYLTSVNSSEMRNDNNIEMLKAQTVAARSTVLATMGKHHFSDGFDLCADDHCQCYQGINKISELSKRVAEATIGEVLMFDSYFVDARYSKICGGITERYSTCWEDMEFSYLAAVTDSDPETEIKEKMSESEAEKFIKNEDFECFCNTKKYSLPGSLNFCRDLFRWEFKISSDDIQKNLKNKFGIDTGTIKDINVLKRGYSGRIYELEIEGEEKRTVISKELNIRRLLSDTHLPSSAFLIERTQHGYILKGAGWGHGAGLCQIGAQIMGEKGYSYKEILKHYYKGSVIKKLRND